MCNWRPCGRKIVCMQAFGLDLIVILNCMHIFLYHHSQRVCLVFFFFFFFFYSEVNVQYWPSSLSAVLFCNKEIFCWMCSSLVVNWVYISLHLSPFTASIIWIFKKKKKKLYSSVIFKSIAWSILDLGFVRASSQHFCWTSSVKQLHQKI